MGRKLPLPCKTPFRIQRISSNLPEVLNSRTNLSGIRRTVKGGDTISAVRMLPKVNNSDGIGACYGN